MKNPFLEKLTRTHILVPLLIFTGIAAFLIYYGLAEKGFQVPGMVLLFLSGFLFFTLIEYLMHRYLFHLPVTNPKREKLVYTIHGVHHEFPKDQIQACHAAGIKSYPGHNIFHILSQYHGRLCLRIFSRVFNGLYSLFGSSLLGTCLQGSPEFS